MSDNTENNDDKHIAFIPARGGSKEIPKKNICLLKGKPLIFHTIEAAIVSGCFTEIWISTDDQEISALCSEGFGNTIRLLKRPANLATDTSRMEEALHFHLNAEKVQAGTLTLLQPTSPLRTARHIQGAIAQFKSTQAKSLLSAVELYYPAQKTLVVDTNGNCNPIVSWNLLGAPRQLLGTSYKPNGAIYIVDIESFIVQNSLYCDPVSLYPMPEYESLDIDNKSDLSEAENRSG